MLQQAQGTALLILIGILLVGFSVFFMRYQWIISLKECVDNAYTEQEKALIDKKEADARRNNRLLKRYWPLSDLCMAKRWPFVRL